MSSSPNPFNFSSSFWSDSSGTNEDQSLPISSDDQAKLRMRGYQIGAFIGKGDYGSVHYALRGGVICGVKSIKIDSETVMIPRDLSFIKKIRHPNVVQLFDCYLTKDGDGKDFMLVFMELAEGGDLKELLMQNGTWFTEEQARGYYLQFGDALRFMHHLGIAHLDLILSNIVLDSTHRVCKVTDFGLTRLTYESHDGQLRTSAVHSQEDYYLAPEYYLNFFYEPEYHLLPLDVWSSGVMLFCMLNFTMPFNALGTLDAENAEIILLDQLSRNYNFRNPTLSMDARRMIYDLLETDPEQRPTFEDIMMNQPWLKNGQESNKDLGR